MGSITLPFVFSREEIGDAAGDGACKVVLAVYQQTSVVVVVDEGSLDQNRGHVGVHQHVIARGLGASVPILVIEGNA